MAKEQSMPEKNEPKQESNPDGEKPPEQKPDPEADAKKNAAAKEATALELEVQVILERGGRDVGSLLERAAIAWTPAGELGNAEVVRKVATQYAADASKKGNEPA